MILSAVNTIEPFNSFAQRNGDHEQTSVTDRQRDTGLESDMKGSIYRFQLTSHKSRYQDI